MAQLVSLLGETASRLEGLVRGLEPARLDGDDVLRALEVIARIVKVGEAGRTVLAHQVEERGLHRRSGYLSAAHLLAATAGTTVGEAAATIETGRRLVEQSELDEAFRAGKVSSQQAVAISEAAEADPAAERALLELSQRESLRTVRAKARAVKAAADEDRLGRYERQRAASYFRHGVDQRDGMVWGEFRLPPDEGAAVVTRVERECDRVFRRAHKEGRRDSHERYAAEALVALVTGIAEGSSGAGAEVLALVSMEALRSGKLEGDELSMIPGFGDVPLEVPRRMLEENAFLTGVLYDGERVQAVRRFGRYRSAAVRSALLVERVLQDGQVVCAVDGCDRNAVHWDHIVALADDGVTEIINLQPLCAAHHREKTAREKRIRRAKRAQQKRPLTDRPREQQRETSGPDPP